MIHIKVNMCAVKDAYNSLNLNCVLTLGLPSPICARTDYNFKSPVSWGSLQVNCSGNIPKEGARHKVITIIIKSTEQIISTELMRGFYETLMVSLIVVLAFVNTLGFSKG